jgi:fructose-1-phosphate kinase PfkB-like protein
VAADTGPAWLGAVVAAGADLISPNLAEALALTTGRQAAEEVEVSPDALPRALAGARQLAQAGTERVIVSAAGAGLAWADQRTSAVLPALPVAVVNPAGAGDALLGATMARLEAGDTFEAALRWGVAAAASAISQWVPGQADPAQTRDFHARLTG